MKPVDPPFKGAKTIYVGKGQPQYEPLPAAIVDGAVYSKWDLSLDERRAILDGARLELFVYTFGQPLQPVYLRIEGIEERAEAAEKEAREGAYETRGQAFEARVQA